MSFRFQKPCLNFHNYLLKNRHPSRQRSLDRSTLAAATYIIWHTTFFPLGQIILLLVQCNTFEHQSSGSTYPRRRPFFPLCVYIHSTCDASLVYIPGGSTAEIQNQLSPLYSLGIIIFIDFSISSPHFGDKIYQQGCNTHLLCCFTHTFLIGQQTSNKMAHKV